MPNSKKFVTSFVTLPFIRRTMKNCVTSLSEIHAKRKSTVVTNRAQLASERCVATDEILCSAFFQNAGVRGCFPDKRFIGSCVTQGLINFARVGTAVHCLPSMFSLVSLYRRRSSILSDSHQIIAGTVVRNLVVSRIFRTLVCRLCCE